MKTKEELNILRDEPKTESKNNIALIDDELKQVTGGEQDTEVEKSHPYIEY